MRGWALHEELAGLEANHLLRSLKVMPSGGEVLNFASNDYLGLAQSEELKEALLQGVGLYGAGTGASRLVSGTRGAHQALEEQLAEYKHTEAALTFSSGYSAYFGLFFSN